jgi:hypothetical protein
VTAPTPAVSYDTYRRLARDTKTAQGDATDAIEDATDQLEDFLQRKIRLGTYTERLRIYYDELATGVFGPAGTVFPSATPITDISALGQGPYITTDGLAIKSVNPDTDQVGLFGVSSAFDRWATVTYTGGWATDACPMTLQRHICLLARAMCSTLVPTIAVPDGATSVRVGDVAMTFGDPANVGAVLSPAAKADLRPYRKRRV